MESYEQRIAKERTTWRSMGAVMGGAFMGMMLMMAANRVIFEPGHPETAFLRIMLDYSVGIFGGFAGYGWHRWGSERFLEWRFRRAATRKRR